MIRKYPAHALWAGFVNEEIKHMDNNEMAMKLLGKTLVMNDEELATAELEALGALTEAE